MVPLTLRMPERGLQLTVMLADETFRPLIGELRIASTQLADKLEQAALNRDQQITELDQRETGLVAVAARVLLESNLVDDPELEHLAQL